MDLESRVTPKMFYSELTDPRHHDPQQFCYIVHGINPVAKNGLLLAAINMEGYDFSQEIDLLCEPERISEKKLISTSIINQDHQGTWGDVFFILDVPWNNFVSISPLDQATNITRPAPVLEYARRPYLTPSRLIEQTRWCSLGSSSAYNEVVVTGTRKRKKVKITGIGIKLTDVGEKVREPEEAPRMRKIGKQLGVPTVELLGYSRIEDSEAEISKSYREGQAQVQAVYINREGYRYFFQGSWDETRIKTVGRSDKHFYGGHNPVTTEEYLSLRPSLAQKLATAPELNRQDFLRELDRWFELRTG
ncbi:MAG: hypothetical protein AABX13_05700 [Nanoarchaeota archaeon]